MSVTIERFYNLSPNLLCMFDESGTLFTANPAWQAAFGKLDPAGSPRNILSIVAPEDRETCRKLFEAIAQSTVNSTPPPEPIITRALDAQGHRRWIKWHGNFETETRRFYFILSPITLTRPADTFMALVNRSDMMVITDLDGRITEVNEVFCRITGYTREELHGQEHLFVRSPSHLQSHSQSHKDAPSDILREEHVAEIWKTISSGKIWQGELCDRAKNGQLYWTDTAIVPLLDPLGQIDSYMAIRRDITERKELEKQLTEADKMATLGQMASEIGHEINNPLSLIRLHSEVLQTRLDELPVELRKSFEAAFNGIVTGYDRIGKIVKALRTFARSGAGDPMARVQVADLLTDFQELARPKLKASRLKLDISFPQDPELAVHCRTSEILQILLNLVNNAVDATALLSERWIRIELQCPPGHVEIRVIDSGTGIPASVAQKIFDPFFTTKPVGKGTGLGLSISRRIAEAHGGTLFVDEQCPHTCFVLRLAISAP